ncbi:MAG: nucleotidyltransferase domain-containing protein [Burkholderiales bacterium]|nr:nucleotidyltransferase domain-containing protein [Burkholderiales bacterium]
MQHSLSDLLFPTYRRRILGLLLLHPELALHVREIARRTGLAAATLGRELTRLAEVGLLTRETRGNQVAYRADVTCPIHADIANVLRKTAGLADVVAEALLPLAEKIEVAFIFGSQATGATNAGSDIDLLVIGDAAFKEIVRAVYEAQTSLVRDINPKVFSPAEWRANLKSKDAFVRDVIAKPKIFLMGNADDLAKLARR